MRNDRPRSDTAGRHGTDTETARTVILQHLLAPSATAVRAVTGEPSVAVGRCPLGSIDTHRLGGDAGRALVTSGR